MRILVLDDLKEHHELLEFKLRGNDITHIYTYEEAKAALSAHDAFDEMYLDHNLGEFSMCSGYDVAMFITCELEDARRPKKVIVHTNNPLAAASMVQLLQDGGIESVALPIVGQ